MFSRIVFVDAYIICFMITQPCRNVSTVPEDIDENVNLRVENYILTRLHTLDVIISLK
jgi:hypothetical protein